MEETEDAGKTATSNSDFGSPCMRTEKTIESSLVPYPSARIETCCPSCNPTVQRPGTNTRDGTSVSLMTELSYIEIGARLLYGSRHTRIVGDLAGKPIRQTHKLVSFEVVEELGIVGLEVELTTANTRAWILDVDAERPPP